MKTFSNKNKMSKLSISKKISAIDIVQLNDQVQYLIHNHKKI